MDIWVYFLLHMPWALYFGLIMFISGIYFVIIAPPIYYFLIIPRIERRYDVDLSLDDLTYGLAFVNWFMPPMECSYYIFFKYMSWDKLVRKKGLPGTLIEKLNSINYDAKKASRAEIVMSALSVFLLAAGIFSGIIFMIYKT